ncbi:MAG: hypothetical protein GQ564_12940 [Bacteroidales bacterium]|nr:hypothetical protein [Bacteroidales bacterium]
MQTVENSSLTLNPTEVIRYQYSNHLGSASLELDDLAEIISYEEYHPFGTTSYRSGRTETETSQKRYKYVGKERNEETRLYYYGARYYAAWICRFVSVDPLQFEYPYYTPYQYAGNKPISYIDLDGLEEAKINDESEKNPKKTEELEGNSDNKGGQCGIAQLYFGIDRNINAEIFTTDDTYLVRNNMYEMIVRGSINIPERDPSLAYQISKHKNLAKTVHPFIESNIIAAATVVGLIATGIDTFSNIQTLRYNYKQANETSRINSVIDMRNSINLSISTGIWLLESFSIAKNQDVFSDLNIDSAPENFAIDVANYGMMVLGGRNNLTKDQHFFHKPTDMSKDRYAKLVNHAFNVLASSIVNDKENSRDKIKSIQLGDRVIRTFLIKGDKSRYRSQPVEPGDFLK